ncbi:hypothetical protein AB0L49_03095 [Streptomyces antimycoticus]|uniref:hypothetical protein n=1 Tax=Streptomyces antimycoticus TaxID=68175 RepID=UPI003443171B
MFPQHRGTSQSNSCDTVVGPEVEIADLATSGDINPNSGCVNFTNSRAVSQSNDCNSTTGITTAGNAALAPTGDIRLGSDCANIAIADNGAKHEEHQKAKDPKHKDPKAKHHKAKAKPKKDNCKPKAKHHKAKHHKAKAKPKKDCKH